MATKRKLPQKLGQPMVRPSAKPLGKSAVDESRAVVSGGGHAIESNMNGVKEVVDISSDSSSEADVEDLDAESVAEEQSAAGEDVAMEDAEVTAAQDILADSEEAGEPSFGDLVRAHASEPIDVTAAFEDPSAQALAFPNAQIQPPSGASLGIVLAQALKTNDVALLESCLQTTDMNTIKATIQRLDSPLAGILIQKIADRVFKRPGRAGSLIIWVQWTTVTHGGYLATQRDLIKKLTELENVVYGRSGALQGVLSLKGKLDMVGAQLEYRKSVHDQQRRIDEEDDDEDVIYVEGEESEEEEEGAKVQRQARNGALGDLSDGDSDISEDMPMANGVIADSEEDSSDEDDLLDDEAEETDADTGDEDEPSQDSQDSQGEESDSESGFAAPPSKISKTSGAFAKKR